MQTDSQLAINVFVSNLISRAGENSENKGFWRGQLPTQTTCFEKLGLVHTEVAEFLEAYWDLDYDGMNEEMWDIVIRLADLYHHIPKDFDYYFDPTNSIDDVKKVVMCNSFNAVLLGFCYDLSTEMDRLRKESPNAIMIGELLDQAIVLSMYVEGIDDFTQSKISKKMDYNETREYLHGKSF